MKNIIFSLFITFLYLPAHATVVNGKNWADFGSFVNVTFNTVDTFFNRDTGECRTSSCIISGVDLTGYQWATSSDIFDLLTNYGVAGTFNSNTTNTFNSALNQFFTDFSLTGNSPDRVVTMSRDYNVSTVDYFNINTNETFFSNSGARTYTSYSSIGHAFFKNVSVVPLPASIWLFISSLAVLGLTLRKRLAL